MKYCPYCGADILDTAVSFCSECGKSLPTKTSSPPQTEKKQKKKHKKPTTQVPQESEKFDDSGYDGYYDDVRPLDESRLKEGMDKKLIRNIALVIGVVAVIIIACVVVLFLL